MPACFTAVAGIAPDGADALRDRLRWTAAELRWQRPANGRVFPSSSPPSQEALRCGAKLTRLTDANLTRAS